MVMMTMLYQMIRHAACGRQLLAPGTQRALRCAPLAAAAVQCDGAGPAAFVVQPLRKLHAAATLTAADGCSDVDYQRLFRGAVAP
jgi:hypothetical protein